MTAFLTGADLASYLGVDRTPAIDTIVRLSNDLVTDEWASPVSPIPSWVTNIAWAVAIRAGSNPQGLTSSTRSWDDITITNRWEAAGGFTGVELTAEENLRLQGLPVIEGGSVPAKSIRMSVPGWSYGECLY